MNALEECEKRKYEKGYKKGFEIWYNEERNKLILKLHKAGMKPEEIAEKLEINPKLIEEILSEI